MATRRRHADAEGAPPASRRRAPRPPRPASVAVKAQGQDRRSRHQGHEGPLPGARRLRGRPDAAAHAAAQAARLQEPVPGRVPGRQPGPQLGELFPEGGDVTVEDLVAKGAVRKGQPVKVLGTGDITVTVDVDGRTRSRPRPRTRSRLPAAAPPRSDLTRLRPGSSMTPRPPQLPGAGASSSAGLLRDGPSQPPPRSTRRSRAHRFRPGVPDAGPAQEAAVHAAIIAVFRLGSFVPPRRHLLRTSGSASRPPTPIGLLGLVNLFSGGALLQLSIFALGIMPYITASIIVQLLTVVIPRFEELKKEGQAGQTKLTQYTRYLTIGLAVLQSTDPGHGRPQPRAAVRPGCACTTIMPERHLDRHRSSWCSR